MRDYFSRLYHEHRSFSDCKLSSYDHQLQSGVHCARRYYQWINPAGYRSHRGGQFRCGEQLETIYKKICKNNPYIARMSVPSAEITKLALNCFVTAKIAFANLIGDIADETPGADKDAITRAIGHDKRVGTKNMKPGFGYGGPCFPRDNHALGNYALAIGINPLFFRTTDQTNHMHATLMAKKLAQKNFKTYVFENVCYKPHCQVPIIENSQKLAVAKKLSDLGKEVIISDTKTVIEKVKEVFKDAFKYSIKK